MKFKIKAGIFGAAGLPVLQNIPALIFRLQGSFRPLERHVRTAAIVLKNHPNHFRKPLG
jgi:hypothetical protein